MMVKFRWAAIWTLVGALGVLIGTVFHPPLTNPWDTSFAFHEMAHHNHWILDHCVFLTGLIFWLIGLAHLSDVHNCSKDSNSSGGRSAARCFIGALVMWMLIISVEIAVLPPLLQKMLLHDTIAREIWNTLFTWGLFVGYVAMVLIYIGIVFLGCICKGINKLLGVVTGVIGILGVLVSLLLPSTALILQLMTAPFPFLWTGWFAIRNIKIITC